MPGLGQDLVWRAPGYPGNEALTLSWPQAASMSLPLVSRRVTVTPRIFNRPMNGLIRSFEEGWSETHRGGVERDEVDVGP